MVLFVWRIRLRYSATHNPSVIAGNDLRNEAIHGGSGCKSRLSAFIFFLLSSLLFSFSTPLFAGSVPAGDLAPYGNPNGQVNIADALILQQFISGSRVPTPTELLLADVAPLGAPDGVLNAADMVVLMRAVTGQITLPPVTRSASPPPPINSFIVVSTPVSGVVTVSGAAGSVEGGTYVTLLNYATGQTVTVKAQSNGSFSANINGASGQVFSVVSTDIFGNASLSTSVGASNLLALNITSPSYGASINDDAVLVTGTFSGPANTAITVNGQVACTVGNTFYAENVPLTTGVNTLTVTASIADGLTSTTTVGVTSTGAATIQVRASPVCGYAAQTVSFAVTNNTVTNIQSIQADFDGNGTVDLTTPNPAGIQNTYTAAGVYRASITVQDSQGANHISQQTIVVNAAADMDTMLRGIYNNMLGRLRVGAIDGALNYVTGGVTDKYRAVFTALKPNLSSIVDSLGTIQGGTISGNMAEYVVVRNTANGQQAFPVYFLKGEDGVWRIDGM